MKTLERGQEPPRHYVAVVQIKEVTEAHRVPATAGTAVIDRQVEDAFTVTVRGVDLESAALRAIGQLETMVDDAAVREKKA